MKLHLLDFGGASQATVTVSGKTYGGNAGSVQALADMFNFQLNAVNIARGDLVTTVRPGDCFARVVEGRLHLVVLTDAELTWTSSPNSVAATSVTLNTSTVGGNADGGGLAALLSNLHVPSVATGLVAGLLLKG